jgi:ribosomal protein S18 acetylase RimI-like enzyme
MDVRLAERGDSNEVQRLVSALLVELGGKALEPRTAAAVYDELISRPELGFVVLGVHEGAARAVCTVSWVHALRSGGPYAIVQEMYVEPALRSSGIGKRVLEHAAGLVRARGAPFVELGTPYEGKRQIEFYRRAGFASVGERLRRVLR